MVHEGRLVAVADATGIRAQATGTARQTLSSFFERLRNRSRRGRARSGSSVPRPSSRTWATSGATVLVPGRSPSSRGFQ
jgi:hypothetical protein